MKLKDAGVVWTHPNVCTPLEQVRVEFEWTGLTGQEVHLEVSDANHKVYLEKVFHSEQNKAETTIAAGGAPGVHHIRVWATGPDGQAYVRHGGFRMHTETTLRTSGGEIDQLLNMVAEAIRQTIDTTLIDGKPITHLKHGDNTRQNLAYPLYAYAGYRYFTSDMKSAFEALFSYQYPDGSLPDHIYGDDYPCPITTRRLRSCMADMEFGAVMTVYKGWEAHGDDAWVAGLMPQIEAAMEHTMTDPMKFDVKHGVVKRTHTLDEWDIQFSPTGPGGDEVTQNSVFVMMQGDTSGMYDACRALATLYTALNNEDRANHWRMMRDHIGKIGNDLFWDGVKYVHHIHLDPFDHGDFDESEQLAMSNAFAINRGFADHEKSVSIIKEYLRRWEETGDRFPWWSLQPGYPDELGYFKGQDKWKRGQGNYANGGLFPTVGGELCLGAFRHGLEDVAMRLLRDYHEVIKRDNGSIFTWYTLEGDAVISAPHNQTNYDSWGLFPWAQSLIEGLAGVRSEGKCFQNVSCSPRWPATDNDEAFVVAHFPASDSYFSYNYRLSEKQIAMTFAGTGKQAQFRLLLPDGKNCTDVMLDGDSVPYTNEKVEQSRYIVFEAPIKGVRSLTCQFE